MTTIGQLIRPCFNATLSHTRLVRPLVPARLGNVFTVDAISGGAVRIKGTVWVRSWLRIQ